MSATANAFLSLLFKQIVANIKPKSSLNLFSRAVPILPIFPLLFLWHSVEQRIGTSSNFHFSGFPSSQIVKVQSGWQFF